MTAAPAVSVVVCVYTECRWDQVLAAVDSARAQPEAAEVLVVVDHNPALLERLREARPAVAVLPNAGPRGLSGARNTGVDAASAPVVAFLDDDAVAEPGWLAHLTAPFADDAVHAVGGRAVPLWPAGHDGRFLAPELLWIVGCTFTGQPTHRAEVRNVMGCSMAVRRDTLHLVGGFDTDTGRVGTLPIGGEETDLCIRIRAALPGARVLFEPRSVVRHAVSADRVGWRYLARRSFYEGVSKSALSGKLGTGAALATELAYTRSVLPRGVLRELRRPADGGVVRAAGIVASLGLAAAGYAYARVLGVTEPARIAAPEPVRHA